MFTGIISGVCRVIEVDAPPGNTHFGVSLGHALAAGVQMGASISVDGVCLTVKAFDATTVWFDAIQETLQRTTLQFLQPGQDVNIERAARMGDEIGGHLLSGHIYGTVSIHTIDRAANNCVVFLKCPAAWTKYLLPKGYVALDGASLTLVDVDHKEGLFSVHLIPETLKRTTFANKKVGDLVNLEIDSQTQVIVDTLERLHATSPIT